MQMIGYIKTDEGGVNTQYKSNKKQKMGTYAVNIPVIKIVLLIFLVFCVLLLCVFTFWVPSCDFRIQTMVGSSLPPVVCKRVHVFLTALFNQIKTNLKKY
jgi:hypothetical protein